jgi:ribonuclease J
VLSGPDIISRGFVYVRESETLMDEAGKIVDSTLNRFIGEQAVEWSFMKNQIRDALNKFLYEQTRRRPMILPIIMEV